MKVQSKVCPMCGESVEIEVPADEYRAFENGEHAQRAMPSLSADDRERLISGTCPKCWTAMFADDNEDD